MSGIASNSFSISVTSGGMPSWYPAVDTIVRIPSSSLEDTPGVPPVPSPPENLHGIMKGWSGGVLAYVSGLPYLVVWGGGHLASADNSIYKFGPLFGSGADSPRWSRHWGPSSNNDIVKCKPYYRDNMPTARHTRGHLAYWNNRMYSFASEGHYCNSGSGSEEQDYFDFQSNQWITSSHPNAMSQLVDQNGAPDRKGAIALHAAAGKAFWKDRGMELWSYTFASDRWQNVGYSGPSPTYDYTAAIDHNNNTMLVGEGANDMNPILINLGNGVGVEKRAGSPPAKTSYAFDPILQKFVAPQGNSRKVYFFDSTTGSWSNKTFAGDTPDKLQGNGTYGRWQYVNELRGCVLVNTTSSSVYFFRTS